MANYKVTDTELTSIANAIRTKGGTSGQLVFPQGFIDAIEAIPSGGSVTVVPWSTGTDDEIAAMVAAMDAGTLTVAGTGWQIGDERTVHLSAMNATGVGESHAAQDVTLVLMDSGHYELTEATAGGSTVDHFVVGMKDCLAASGYMDDSTASGVSTCWTSCARRTWCNSVFKNAIPSGLRSIFKQFRVPSTLFDTDRSTGSNTLTYTNDYFALFAATEIQDYTSNIAAVELAAVSKLDYYETEGHRVKKRNNSNAPYWTRTLSTQGNFHGYQYITSSGGMSSNYAPSDEGISLFGCI